MLDIEIRPAESEFPLPADGGRPPRLLRALPVPRRFPAGIAVARSSVSIAQTLGEGPSVTSPWEI